MGGNDKVKVSAWILELDFGINTLQRPNQDLLSGVFFTLLQWEVLLSMVHIIAKEACISFKWAGYCRNFFSRKVLSRLLQSWWDSELVQNSLATSTWITFLHWEGFVAGSSGLCPETSEAGQRKLQVQEVNVKSNKKSTGQATSLGLIKMLLTIMYIRNYWLIKSPRFFYLLPTLKPLNTMVSWGSGRKHCCKSWLTWYG